MPNKTSSIDKMVGSRVEQRRRELGVSSIELASAIGVDPMTLRRYETGARRISAHRLRQLCDHLKVNVSFFFQPNDRTGAVGGTPDNSTPEQDAQGFTDPPSMLC